MLDLTSLSAFTDYFVIATADNERQLNALIDAVGTEELDGGTALTPQSTQMVSDSIFHDYLIPFEAVSFLLLAALIGAIIGFASERRLVSFYVLGTLAAFAALRLIGMAVPSMSPESPPSA